MIFRQFSRVALSVLAAAAIYSVANSALADAAPQVKFATTAGDFVVEVYPDKAPKTVENFLQYVKDKHYDGTISVSYTHLDVYKRQGPRSPASGRAG